MKWCTCTTFQMLANILLIHVVIIFPLLLATLSVNLVVLLTLSCVTVPPP